MDDDYTVESGCSSEEDEDYFDLTVWLVDPKGDKKTMVDQVDDNLCDPWGELGNPGKERDMRDDTLLKPGEFEDYRSCLRILQKELEDQKPALQQAARTAELNKFGGEIAVFENLLGDGGASLISYCHAKDQNFLPMTPHSVGNLVKDKHQKEIAEMPGDDLARRAIEIVVNKAESIQATVMATYPSVSRDSVSLHAMLYCVHVDPRSQVV